MNNSHMTCQNCGNMISFVHIDRAPNADKFDVARTQNWNFYTSENTKHLKDHRILLPIPANAMCRNCGDEDFIRETIHCPECGQFPFGIDICDIFDSGCLMSVVFNEVNFDRIDASGNLIPQKKICAHCQRYINEGDKYFRVTDNYLQSNYFDSEKMNIFCCEQCLMDSLMVKSFVCGKENANGNL